MAEALSPSAAKRKRARTDMTVTITLQGKSLVVPMGNLPLRHSAALRKVTGGLPPRVFYDGRDAVDLDTLKVMWWMGRRCNGESELTVDEMEADWPDSLDPDDIEVIVETEDDDAIQDGADPE